MRINKLILLSLLMISSLLFSQEKYKSFQEIKNDAKQLNKNILIKFSGSDWCVPCIKLQKKVIEEAIFQEFLTKNLIFVEADFPRKKGKISPETVIRNKELADYYNKQGIFPKLVLIDFEGKILKEWEGFDKTSASIMIQEISQTINK